MMPFAPRSTALPLSVGAAPVAMDARPVNLLDLDLADCERLVTDWGFKPFHGRNLFKWLHKHGVDDSAAMTDLPHALRARLATDCTVAPPRIAAEQPSADGTIKWLFELADGQRIETVFIPDNARRTLCLSTQVGCALDCAFCATARQGLSRNLRVGEIVGQLWAATRRLGQPPTNVVLMGMGEPLANFSATVKATRTMRHDLAYMLARGRVTLSTAGLVPRIDRLRTAASVALAVSLHAPDNALRDRLVPLNRAYPLERLIPACKAYVAGDKRRRVTWEYVMLAEVNDHDAHAKALIRLLEGVPSKVNLIPFNPFPGSTFAASSPERIEAFGWRLRRSGLVTTTRKTRGDEIAAACGQLVGRVARRGARAVPPATGVAP